MFGCPAYFVNNNMFASVHQDNIILRLSVKERREIKSKYDESEPFEPMKGSVMKEYMTIPEELYNDPEELNKWLHRSFKFTSSMPLKKKKAKSEKK